MRGRGNLITALAVAGLAAGIMAQQNRCTAGKADVPAVRGALHPSAGKMVGRRRP